MNRLHQAVFDNDIGLVRQLLTTEGENIDANAKDDYGHTPLHIASKYGDLEIVNALITAGADVNTKDDDGWIPLYDASRRGHLEIVNALSSWLVPLGIPIRLNSCWS